MERKTLMRGLKGKKINAIELKIWSFVENIWLDVAKIVIILTPSSWTSDVLCKLCMTRLHGRQQDLGFWSTILYHGGTLKTRTFKLFLSILSTLYGCSIHLKACVLVSKKRLTVVLGTFRNAMKVWFQTETLIIESFTAHYSIHANGKSGVKPIHTILIASNRLQIWRKDAWPMAKAEPKKVKDYR